MQLTKTEQTLIERAKQHPHNITSVQFGYKTTSSGSKSFGSREHDAAVKLVKKGVFVFVEHYYYTIYQNGYSTHCTDASYKLKTE